MSDGDGGVAEPPGAAIVVRSRRARRERGRHEGRDAHHDAAPAGDRRELSRARHRVADEAQVVDGVRVERRRLATTKDFIARRARQDRQDGRVTTARGAGARGP